MNSNIRTLSDEEQEEFWRLLNRPLRTIILKEDMKASNDNETLAPTYAVDALQMAAALEAKPTPWYPDEVAVAVEPIAEHLTNRLDETLSGLEAYKAIQEVQASTPILTEDTTALVTKAEMEELILNLKSQLNDSLTLLAEYVVGVQDRQDVLESRIDVFNRRSGQKI